MDSENSGREEDGRWRVERRAKLLKIISLWSRRAQVLVKKKKKTAVSPSYVLIAALISASACRGAAAVALGALKEKSDRWRRGSFVSAIISIFPEIKLMRYHEVLR